MRDVVVSGGDIANLPITVLEPFVSALLDIENIRDIRLASKGLMGHPAALPAGQRARRGSSGWRRRRSIAGVDLALHTHVNHAQQVTPLVGKAARKLLEIGFRDVRNQGVLLRGVNTTPKDLLDLCFMLLDHAKIMPYYFYMCDMIPNSEHWRLGVFEAQQLQHDIMGYLPGFATPRIVCDVPYVGQALGPPARRLRPREGHLATGPRTTGPASRWTCPDVHDPAVRVLRSDLPAARVGPGVVAGADGP